MSRPVSGRCPVRSGPGMRPSPRAARHQRHALATVATPEAAADVVHVRAHRRAFELASLAGWARLHAATVDLTRPILVAPRGDAKNAADGMTRVVIVELIPKD